MSKRSLSGRGLVSVLTLTSFLVLAFTGCILFVTPPGRVANWTGWTMLGLTKHEWGALVPYNITGQLNQHPRSAISMLGDDAKYNYVDFYDRLVADL